MRKTPYMILRRTWTDYGTSAFYEKLKIASEKTMVLDKVIVYLMRKRYF